MRRGRIEIIRADITTLDVDAVVNAANAALAGGGGVDGAIHRAAGPGLMSACRALGGCETGSAKITEGFDLPAHHVIHAVGPIWDGGEKGEPELLASCYRTCFALAIENGVRTIAFPAISCGVYGFPIPAACEIAMGETLEFLSSDGTIERVVFACFGEETERELTRVHRETTEPDGEGRVI